MTEFIVLSRVDILTLRDDKPVTIYVNKKPYVLCTDEYFEKQRNEPKESEKINCKATKCENCQNHNYCYFEPQERSDKG